MATDLFIAPAGSRERLVAHYGPSVHEWLDTAPATIQEAAQAWGLGVTGLYDAGHASLLATATDHHGAPLLIKAWPDRDRYRREIAALRFWYTGPETVVQAADDRNAVAVLVMVGGRPGGSSRPHEEELLVAEALRHLHELGASSAPSDLPPLEEYVTKEVVPRIHRRQASTGHGDLTRSALAELIGLHNVPQRTTLLHGDLYRENIPFGHDGRPVLLDPVPMVGDALFDWAFWIVYYEVGQRTDQRLRRAFQTSGISVSELLPWCVLLALDGFLFYEETGDRRLAAMSIVLSALVERSRRSS
ncbi:aminoglycoside phosphotransferase family protein [Streptomyces sp. NBC_01396]|uniref:aminoglycoside phosphotransferase family protein n=1 Tax=Streptomyces sp. NBC_01396 TaxID=2903852 RepID=UPI003245636E